MYNQCTCIHALLCIQCIYIHNMHRSTIIVQLYNHTIIQAYNKQYKYMYTCTVMHTMYK